MVVSRDRTNELSQIFEDIKRQNGGRAGQAAPPQRQLSEFHQKAQQVTVELTSTAEMLENLSKLTKQNTAFDDHSHEVNQMTIVVKDKMTALHEKLIELGQLKDSTRQWGKTQANDHTDTVVKTLKTQLFASQKSFKDIITKRAQIVKQVSDRRSKFTHSSEREFTSSVFRNARMQEEEESLMPSRGGLALQQQQNQDSSMQYYRQRQEGVKMLEETIAQLGSLFQDFSRIVAEQEELIQRIDQNTEVAEQNVIQGQNYLLTYLNNISSNRSLIMKVFGILFVFVIVFGVFVVK